MQDDEAETLIEIGVALLRYEVDNGIRGLISLWEPAKLANRFEIPEEKLGLLDGVLRKQAHWFSATCRQLTEGKIRFDFYSDDSATFARIRAEWTAGSIQANQSEAPLESTKERPTAWARIDNPMEDSESPRK